MESTPIVQWTFIDKTKFVLTYGYYKLRLLIDVKTPKLRFFAFEAAYSLVNLANTIRPHSFKSTVYTGPNLLRTRNGTFFVRSGTQDAAVASPAFERQDLEFLSRVLEKDFSTSISSGVLDVGANIGVYTIQTALRTNPNVKIWAFEPIEANRKVLEENLRLNSLGKEKVTVFPFALGQSDGEIEIQYAEAFPGHASTEVPQGDNAKVFRVEQRKADHVISAPPQRLLIKIDVEGHESEVLKGMTELIKRADLVWLCIEDIMNREQLYSQLSQLGFEFQAKVTPYNSWWKRSAK